MASYRLPQESGPPLHQLRPALVQLKSSYPRCASLKGIRAVCRLWLTQNGENHRGKSGRSPVHRLWPHGPAIFELSGRLHRTRRLGLPPGSAAQPDGGRPQGFPHPAQAAGAPGFRRKISSPAPYTTGWAAFWSRRPRSPLTASLSQLTPGLRCRCLGSQRLPLPPSPVLWAWTAPRSPPGALHRGFDPLHWKAACAPGYTPAASF